MFRLIYCIIHYTPIINLWYFFPSQAANSVSFHERSGAGQLGPGGDYNGYGRWVWLVWVCSCTIKAFDNCDIPFNLNCGAQTLFNPQVLRSQMQRPRSLWLLRRSYNSLQIKKTCMNRSKLYGMCILSFELMLKIVGYLCMLGHFILVLHFLFFCRYGGLTLLNNMDVDRLHPVSSFCHTIFFCLLLTESTALSCTVVFNENVTINSWELELKIKPRLNWNSLVCHDTPSEAWLWCL